MPKFLKTKLGLALSLIVLIAAIFLTGHYAAVFAADLGGNCCADLEERIAELEATTARKGNRKVSLKVYGQVSETIMYWSEPGFTHTQIQSGANRDMDTFVGFVGEAKIAKDTFAGFVLEIEASNFVNGAANPLAGGNDTNGIGNRQAYAYIRNAQVGALSIGLQKDATWNITGLTGQIDDDLASTAVARTKLSSRPAFGAGIDAFVDLWDGVRNESLKYTSPVWAGFTLSATWGDAINVNATSATGFAQGNIWDVALRFNKEIDQFRVQAAVGYRDGTAIQDFPMIGGLGGIAIQDVKVFSGSAGIQHMPTGLFANASYGNTDLTSLAPGSGANNITAWELQAGDEMHLTALGHTTVFAGYAKYDLSKLYGVSEQPWGYGLGVVQAIDPASMSLYLLWTQTKGGTPGLPAGFGLTTVGSDTVVTAGARVKF